MNAYLIVKYADSYHGGTSILHAYESDIKASQVCDEMNRNVEACPECGDKPYYGVTDIDVIKGE
jgi:hypothetical protein